MSITSDYRTKIPQSTWDPQMDRRLHLNLMDGEIKPFPVKHQEGQPPFKKEPAEKPLPFWMGNFFLSMIATGCVLLLLLGLWLAFGHRFT